MLPSDATTGDAIAVSMVGDILEVYTSNLLTPSFISILEKKAGMPISLFVATKEVMAHIRKEVQDSKIANFNIAPAMQEAATLGASDLHLAVGTPPIVRIDGSLRPLDKWPALSVEDLKQAAEFILGKDELLAFEGDADRAITYQGHRWRVSVYHQRQSLAMAMRLIPSEVPGGDKLGLPLGVLNIASHASGLVLFCGATGSGKTTSMAALVDRINKDRECHILTIEDPIEYLHANKRAIIHQREVGTDTVSFPIALRGSMRQDPDVILVGELRDTITMATALAAAESGHLVLATVHASSTTSAITRIVSSFPASEQEQIRIQLADSFLAIVFQTLLPKIDGGRVLACEVLISNTATKSNIKDNKLESVAGLLDTQDPALGMMSIDKSLARLVTSGIISEETALPYVGNKASYDIRLAERPEV
jgi:twitching motility protein PilT